MAMTFAERLHEILWADDAIDRLNAYLTGDAYAGRRFETYGAFRMDPFNITGDDLVAVTTLSIEIKLNTTSGISPASALVLEDQSATINALLTRLPVHAKLHELTESEMTALLLGPDSPGMVLWEVLFETLTGAGTQKKVSTSKLLARKRPNLIPVFDRRNAKLLGGGEKWWWSWWDALSRIPNDVQRLRDLRAQAGALHLSLLRVADIVVWMTPS